MTVVQQVVSSTPREAQFRHFLDGSQYTQNGILRYERIFGPGFVSTGGVDTTRELTQRLGLQPGQKVRLAITWPASPPACSLPRSGRLLPVRWCCSLDCCQAAHGARQRARLLGEGAPALSGLKVCHGHAPAQALPVLQVCHRHACADLREVSGAAAGPVSLPVCLHLSTN